MEFWKILLIIIGCTIGPLTLFWLGRATYRKWKEKKYYKPHEPPSPHNTYATHATTTTAELTQALNRVAALECELADLRASSQVTTTLTANLELLSAQRDNLEQLITDKEKMQWDIEACQSRLDTLRNSEVEVIESAAAAREELAMCATRLLAIQKQIAVENLNNTLRMRPDESYRLEKLREIAVLYPEFERDFGKIMWEKIWRPKLGALVENAVLALGVEGFTGRCIYKVTSKDGLIYIGQAQDLKKRWSDHIKKMCGADAKGNERLYDYRPEDMTWEIVQSVGALESINEAEQFWIDSYGSNVWGLNMKR